ncbi:MAG: RidA family protein [Sutterellaceae bacterium]|nr:RidA family protein [Sutterellaceae bacterium]MDD7441267.1 RidA family protein [Sutterellaceae bacterium]MDY2867143.1 RidA family protein [Mesosutterella sp.]
MEKSVVATAGAPAAIGPYSQGISGCGLVFVSGQLPVDPKTGAMPETIEEQARQSLENVKAILEAGGSCLCHVVKTTCYLADINDFAAFNKVYAEYFPKDAPARSCFQVAALPKAAKLEVEAIALVK